MLRGPQSLAGPSAAGDTAVAQSIVLAVRLLDGLPSVRELSLIDAEWSAMFAELAEQLTAQTEQCLASCSSALASIQTFLEAQAKTESTDGTCLVLPAPQWTAIVAALQQWAASVAPQVPAWVAAAVEAAKRSRASSMAVLAQMHALGHDADAKPAIAVNTANEMQLLLQILKGPDGQAAAVNWMACILTQVLEKVSMPLLHSGTAAQLPITSFVSGANPLVGNVNHAIAHANITQSDADLDSTAS